MCCAPDKRRNPSLRLVYSLAVGYYACGRAAAGRRDAVQILCKPVGAIHESPLRYRTGFYFGCRFAARLHSSHFPKDACASFFFSHASAHQILQNLFAFVIFLSHSFGILISVKGIPRGINECRLQPPVCAGIGREHASPLSPCGFACSRKPNDPIFADVFHIFLLKKKRCMPLFSFS